MGLEPWSGRLEEQPRMHTPHFRPNFNSFCCLGLGLALLMLPFNGRAQTTFGSITGSVSDSSGAVMARVPVTVTNSDTRIARRVQTAE